MKLGQTQSNLHFSALNNVMCGGSGYTCVNVCSGLCGEGRGDWWRVNDRGQRSVDGFVSAKSVSQSTRPTILVSPLPHQFKSNHLVADRPSDSSVYLNPFLNVAQ